MTVVTRKVSMGGSRKEVSWERETAIGEWRRVDGEYRRKVLLLHYGGVESMDLIPEDNDSRIQR
jgi:hypothetical protein